MIAPSTLPWEVNWDLTLLTWANYHVWCLKCCDWPVDIWWMVDDKWNSCIKSESAQARREKWVKWDAGSNFPFHWRLTKKQAKICQAIRCVDEEFKSAMNFVSERLGPFFATCDIDFHVHDRTLKGQDSLSRHMAFRFLTTVAKVPLFCFPKL